MPDLVSRHQIKMLKLALAACPQLVRLELPHATSLTDSDMAEVSRRLPRLTYLDLTNCPRVSFASFYNLASQLHVFIMDRMEMTARVIAPARHDLVNWPQLRRLSVVWKYNLLPHVIMSDLARTCSSHVEHLSLGVCDEQVLERLASTRWLALTHLSLYLFQCAKPNTLYLGYLKSSFDRLPEKCPLLRHLTIHNGDHQMSASFLENLALHCPHLAPECLMKLSTFGTGMPDEIEQHSAAASANYRSAIRSIW
jgi:hypothetical protein